MAEPTLDERVRSFLATHISSIEQLEVLLLLRATAHREWTSDECSREARSDARWIRERLADFTARGFVVAREVEGVRTYRYAPSTGDLKGLIDGAATAYKERRLSVINIIYGKVESDVMSFSDAFTILKKKGG